MQFTSMIIAAILATPLLAAAVPETLDPRNTCPVKCTPGGTYGGTCKYVCGKDRYGDYYKLIQLKCGETFETCAKYCKEDKECATAQCHLDNGYCYLKKKDQYGKVPALKADEKVGTVDCRVAPGS